MTYRYAPSLEMQGGSLETPEAVSAAIPDLGGNQQIQQDCCPQCPASPAGPQGAGLLATGNMAMAQLAEHAGVLGSTPDAQPEDPCPKLSATTIAGALAHHHLLASGHTEPNKSGKPGHIIFIGAVTKKSSCFVEFSTGEVVAISFAKYPYYLLAQTLWKDKYPRCTYDFKCTGARVTFGPGSCTKRPAPPP